MPRKPKAKPVDLPAIPDELLKQFCIDPAKPAQVKQLKQMPQPGFSSSAPGGAVDGCKTESSRQSPGWRAARFRNDADARIAL